MASLPPQQRPVDGQALAAEEALEVGLRVVGARRPRFFGKTGVRLEDGPHVLEVRQIVRGESQFAARRERSVCVVQKRRLDEPVDMVPPLGPWIGKHDVKHLDRLARQQVAHQIMAFQPDEARVKRSGARHPAATDAHAPLQPFHAQKIPLRETVGHLHQKPAVAGPEIDFQRRAGLTRKEVGEVERRKIIPRDKLDALGRDQKDGLHGMARNLAVCGDRGKPELCPRHPMFAEPTPSC